MLPAYHQTLTPQSHISPTSQQDQSLRELVQSRTASHLAGFPCCSGGSPHRPRTHQEGMPKPGKQQQAASPKLTKRQSGNPFASDYPIEERSAALRQQGSSLLSRAVSGNPFAATRELDSASSRLASSQDQAVSGHLAGHLLNVGSKGDGMQCSASDMESNVAAAGSVQQHSQPCTQPALLTCVGSSAHPACSPATALKNPEMSPLQNGLIR